MVNQTCWKLGTVRSSIRELFEYGNRQRAVVGADNVFDFSLGNPSVEPPKVIQQAMLDILREESPFEVHSYTSAQGSPETRQAIATNLNERFGTAYGAEHLYLTCGAAAALTTVFGALTASPSSSIIAIAPFFPEYRCFVEASGAVFKVLPADTDAFQIKLDELAALIDNNTQAVIINSPNNPSGVVYNEKTVQALADLLRSKSAEYGHPIYLVSDEPYRELVYDDVTVPFLPNYYENTIVCYSFSKIFSLPGERIGYILVPPSVENWQDVYAACAGSARALGYVCAPSFMQRVIARAVATPADLESYTKNRRLLLDKLTSIGYEVAPPDGAFYLFLKAPGGDAAAFSELAKTENVLLVPSDSFGCEGYLRLAYCVDHDMIVRSLPAFKRLYEKATH